MGLPRVLEVTVGSKGQVLKTSRRSLQNVENLQTG